MIDFDAAVLAPCFAIFGEPVTWTPARGAPIATTGVFDEKAIEVKFQDGTEVHEARPVVNLRAAILPSLPLQGDRITIRGVPYVITNIDPDSAGDLRCGLRCATDQAAGILPP